MAYTTSMQATRTWITDPTLPGGTKVVCGSRAQSGVGETLDGAMRYFAGGRVEGVVFTQDTYEFPLTLVHLSPTDATTIRAWRGRVVLVRTVDGERFFGFYLETQTHRQLSTTPDDNSDVLTYDIDVTFTRVSFDETLI